MAGFLFPMLLDAIGGGASGYHEMASMTSIAQDSSADSSVWNTQGPSANHGSINFNFHVNIENFTSPMGSNSGSKKDSQHLDQLIRQNHFLRTIINQIVPSVIPQGARRKRSAEETSTPRNPKWGKRPIRHPGGRYNGTRVLCCQTRLPDVIREDLIDLQQQRLQDQFYPLPYVGHSAQN